MEQVSHDIDGTAVKVGDRLRCIDAEASFRRLQAGNLYVAEAAYNGDPIINVGGAYHSIDRFRLNQEAAMFKVTKRFTSGTFKGTASEEVTAVEFKVGHVVKPNPWCGPGYIVEKVEAVMKEAA